MTGYPLPLAQPSALDDSRPQGKVATSREAFREHRDSGKRATEQERIADYITRRGSEGATSQEVIRDLGLGPQSVSARLNELMRAGYIGRNGDRRRLGFDGPTAFVWRFIGGSR